jgi:SRSO17 transposase
MNRSGDRIHLISVMNTTITPDLAPDVLRRLSDYAALFRPAFCRHDQARWAGAYLQGLLRDGERKSIEPLAGRVVLPPDWRVTDPAQALQNFVNQSPWDEQDLWQRYRQHLAQTFASPDGRFVLDDTSFPKQGTESVGVQRQYCGALGKTANCQVAVSWHYVSPKGHYPLGLRLYLPDRWLPEGRPLTRAQRRRLDAAGVPRDEQYFRTKGQIALALLDRVRAEGLPGQVVVADAGYGNSGALRQGLADRQLFYLVGVQGDTQVFTQQPRWEIPPWTGQGRPPTRPRLTADAPRPVAVQDLARQVTLRRKTWREGTKGKLSARFAWLWVWPGHGGQTGDCAAAGPLWLLIEERANGELRYALSNLPPETSCVRAVRLWKSRWPVEQGYQQMKEELGLDHFEGRSWRGFHHHACLVMLAFGFLLLERLRAAEAGAEPPPWATLPALRRGLQRLLQPQFPLECPHCHETIQHPLLN